MSYKKRRRDPSQWSWTSKLYNASALAAESAEQSKQLLMLSAQLHASIQKNEEKVQECVEWKNAYEEWKASSISHQKKNEEHSALIESLRTANANKQKEIENLQASVRMIEQGLEKKLHDTKRECMENRARKKMWKKKYEELAHMGAVALAQVTNESYGVSPEQFQAYKKIADTQLEVDKAHQLRTDALKMLHSNNTLKDK